MSIRKKIVVCDSGLGGLSIAEQFFRPSLSSGTASAGGEEYDILYINAFPDSKVGYNDLPSEKAQEEVFQNVLEGMKKFEPALCLIACNTLSIIYDRLKQYYTAPFPVQGIVECAAEGMVSFLRERSPESDLLILGTLTTVRSAVYEKAVAARGVPENRIHSLAVPGLAKSLESGVDTPAVQHLIRQAAEQSVQVLKDANSDPARPLALGLCCTHYGYAAGQLKEEFRKAVCRKEVVCLNPNEWMCPETMAGRGKSFAYKSRIGFFPGSREVMSRYFAGRGVPVIASALEQASEEEDLFELPEQYQKRS